jgi:hypothetical protein
LPTTNAPTTCLPLSSKLEYCSNLEADEKARTSDRKYADNLVLLRNELSKETKMNPALGN